MFSTMYPQSSSLYSHIFLTKSLQHPSRNVFWSTMQNTVFQGEVHLIAKILSKFSVSLNYRFLDLSFDTRFKFFHIHRDRFYNRNFILGRLSAECLKLAVEICRYKEPYIFDCSSEILLWLQSKGLFTALSNS